MKTLKRLFAYRRLLCGLAAGAFCATGVAADPYPSQPITLVNPYAAGGPADVLGQQGGRRRGDRCELRGARQARRLHPVAGHVGRA
ncbi:hypothetical protein G6F35_013922 [Rhizopus arrhizus]|nr:hypothetical protein G6F35_013922 [Rhizopus arrhizus]